MSLSLLLSLLAGSASPLTLLGQSGALNGGVYLQGSDLVVGSPAEPGRPGFLPALGGQLFQLPDDLGGFKVLGQDCDRKGTRNLPVTVSLGKGMRALGQVVEDLNLDGERETIMLQGPTPNAGELLPYVPLSVLVFKGGESIGRYDLDVTAFACEILVQELAGDARPEIVVVWKSVGGSGYTAGATVLGLKKP